MENSVQGADGGEMMKEGELRYRRGDIIEKEKHGRLKFYFITDVRERNGVLEYRYSKYQNELFEGYDGSRWKKAAYFDKRVETAGEENQWIDYDMGSFEHIGHVTEDEHLIDLTGHQYFSLSFEKFDGILNQGIHVVRDAWMFYETVGTNQAVTVRNVGWESEGLADDMLKLRYFNEDKSFVEHQKHVREAVEKGIWIPIREVTSRII